MLISSICPILSDCKNSLFWGAFCCSVSWEFDQISYRKCTALKDAILSLGLGCCPSLLSSTTMSFWEFRVGYLQWLVVFER